MMKVIFSFLICLSFARASEVLKFGLPNEMSTSSLYGPGIAQSKYILTLVYESLVRFNSNHEIEPLLAKSWVVNPKDESIDFKIAIKHYFSNGKFVSAEDVVRSLKLSCAKSSDAKVDFSSIKECGTDSPQIFFIDSETVRIKFQGSPSLLLYELAGLRAGISLPVGNHFLGSGAYYFSDINSNKLKLVKNEYNIMTNPTRLDVEFYNIGEVDVAKKVLEFNLDGTIMFRFTSVEDSIPKYSFIDDQSSIVMTLVPNLQRAPFNNLAFRRALMKKLSGNSEFSNCHRKITPAFGLIPVGIGGSIAHIPFALPDVDVSEVRSFRNKFKNLKIKIARPLNHKDQCEEKIVTDAFTGLGLSAKFVYYSNYELLKKQQREHSLDAFMEIYIFANREAFTILRKFLGQKENLANLKSKNISEQWNNI